MTNELLDLLESTILSLDTYSSIRMPLMNLMVKVRAQRVLGQNDAVKNTVEEMLKLLV